MKTRIRPKAFLYMEIVEQCHSSQIPITNAMNCTIYKRLAYAKSNFTYRHCRNNLIGAMTSNFYGAQISGPELPVLRHLRDNDRYFFKPKSLFWS